MWSVRANTWSACTHAHAHTSSALPKRYESGSTSSWLDSWCNGVKLQPLLWWQFCPSWPQRLQRESASEVVFTLFTSLKQVKKKTFVLAKTEKTTTAFSDIIPKNVAWYIRIVTRSAALQNHSILRKSLLQTHHFQEDQWSTRCVGSWFWLHQLLMLWLFPIEDKRQRVIIWVQMKIGKEGAAQKCTESVSVTFLLLYFCCVHVRTCLRAHKSFYCDI